MAVGRPGVKKLGIGESSSGHYKNIFGNSIIEIASMSIHKINLLYIKAEHIFYHPSIYFFDAVKI